MQRLLNSLNPVPSPEESEKFVKALMEQLTIYKTREEERKKYHWLPGGVGIGARLKMMKDAKSSQVEFGIGEDDKFQGKTLIEHLLERKKDDIVRSLILKETYSIGKIFLSFLKIQDQGLGRNYFNRVLLMISPDVITKKIIDKNRDLMEAVSMIINERNDYFFPLARLINNAEAMDRIIMFNGCCKDVFFLLIAIPLIAVIIGKRNNDIINYVLDICTPGAIKKSIGATGYTFEELLAENTTLNQTEKDTFRNKISGIFKQIDFNKINLKNKISANRAENSRNYNDENGTELSEIKEHKEHARNLMSFYSDPLLLPEDKNSDHKEPVASNFSAI